MVKQINQLQEINMRYREHTSDLRSKIENVVVGIGRSLKC